MSNPKNVKVPQTFVASVFLGWGDGTTLAQQTETTLVPSKRAAFTLAEVLITLGVIGVVAALTMPTLIQNHKNTQLAVQAKKSYSTVAQAILKAKADQGVEWVSDTDILTNREKYLGVVKSGNTNDSDANFPDYSLLNGTKTTIQSLPCGSQTSGGCTRDYDVLKDGSIIIWDTADTTATRDIYTSVIVDVNGFKKPNQQGRDVFRFAISREGRVLPYGMVGISIDSSHGWGSYTSVTHHNGEAYSDCDLSSTGYGCAARLMQNGWKMDY